MDNKAKRKEKFLSSLNYTKGTLKRYELVINHIKDYEERFNKDLADFSDEQIMEVFCEIEHPNHIYIFRTVLHNYFDFCAIKGYIEIKKNPLESSKFELESIFEKNKGIESAYIKENYLSFEQVRNDMNTLKKVSDRSASIYFQFLYLALYEGLTIKDIVNAKEEDLNIEHRYIKVIRAKTEYNLTISDELAILFKSVKNISSFYGIKRMIELNCELPLIKISIRGKCSETVACNFLRKVLIRYISKILEKNVNQLKLGASGTIHYLMSESKKDKRDFFDDISNDDKNESTVINSYYEKLLINKGIVDMFRQWKYNHKVILMELGKIDRDKL